MSANGVDLKRLPPPSKSDVIWLMCLLDNCKDPEDKESLLTHRRMLSLGMSLDQMFDLAGLLRIWIPGIDPVIRLSDGRPLPFPSLWTIEAQFSRDELLSRMGRVLTAWETLTGGDDGENRDDQQA